MKETFLERHGPRIASSLVTIVAAAIGFAWVAGIQSEKISSAATLLDERVEKVETQLASSSTLELRVSRLETSQQKLDGVITRLEHAVIRLEAMTER